MEPFWTKNAIASSGDVITAAIQGKESYTGTDSVIYGVTGRIRDLFRGKISLVRTKEYTG